MATTYEVIVTVEDNGKVTPLSIHRVYNKLDPIPLTHIVALGKWIDKRLRLAHAGLSVVKRKK